jgi:hypothetical protein
MATNRRVGWSPIAHRFLQPGASKLCQLPLRLVLEDQNGALRRMLTAKLAAQSPIEKQGAAAVNPFDS